MTSRRFRVWFECDGTRLSPWHDIPLRNAAPPAGAGSWRRGRKPGGSDFLGERREPMFRCMREGGMAGMVVRFGRLRLREVEGCEVRVV